MTRRSSRWLFCVFFAGSSAFWSDPAAASPPGGGDPWAALKFGAQAFDEIVDLGAGQHLNPKIPKRAWRAAADGALRVLPTKNELFPLSMVSSLPQLIGAGLVRQEDARALVRLQCRERGLEIGILRSSSARRIPKMKSAAEIRAYRKKRKQLKSQMSAAWANAPFGRDAFECVMNWVQAQVPKHVPAELPGSVTVTRRQQRGWDAWRIAASHFLQGLDPHCNVYPNRLFEAQERAAAKRKPVTAQLIGDKKWRVGYMRVHQFATGTAKQARASLDALESGTRGGLRALVLDMRGNTGGWVEEAVPFADMFLGDAVITEVHSRDKVDRKRAKKDKSDLRVPMVVLIDARCRSSCELVTAALHENNRAVVVGARSYGKATVQGVFDGQEGPWSIFVTIARYHGPQGESLQRYGVTPDVAIAALQTEGKKVWRESQFEHALAPPRKQPPHKTSLLGRKKQQKCYAKIKSCDPADIKTSSGELAVCVAREIAYSLGGGCKR